MPKIPDQVSGKLYIRRQKSGIYYTAIVFRDADLMRQWWKRKARDLSFRTRGDTKRGDHTFEAQATWWKTFRLRKSRWSRGLCCGFIIFHRGRIGAGIVSHEMTHAALYHLAYEKKMDPLKSKRADELLAWTQGWLTSQFWTWYYKCVEPDPWQNTSTPPN